MNIEILTEEEMDDLAAMLDSREAIPLIKILKDEQDKLIESLIREDSQVIRGRIQQIRRLASLRDELVEARKQRIGLT